jgi:hypothetical protein
MELVSNVVYYESSGCNYLVGREKLNPKVPDSCLKFLLRYHSLNNSKNLLVFY